METKQEKLTFESYDVKIRYADKDNPEALAAMRALLENQKITPEKSQKIDDNDEK